MKGTPKGIWHRLLKTYPCVAYRIDTQYGCLSPVTLINKKKRNIGICFRRLHTLNESDKITSHRTMDSNSAEFAASCNASGRCLGDHNSIIIPAIFHFSNSYQRQLAVRTWRSTQLLTRTRSATTSSTQDYIFAASENPWLHDITLKEYMTVFYYMKSPWAAGVVRCLNEWYYPCSRFLCGTQYSDSRVGPLADFLMGVA